MSFYIICCDDLHTPLCHDMSCHRREWICTAFMTIYRCLSSLTFLNLATAISSFNHFNLPSFLSSKIFNTHTSYVHAAAVLGCDGVIYNDLEDIVEAVRSCNPGSLLVSIPTALLCAVLPCPVLPCAVLPCAVLCCAVLCCAVLSYPVIPCAALPCPVLPCPVRPCPACSFLLNTATSTPMTILIPFSRTQQTTQYDAI